ncbi:MAG: hypothetical protein Q8O89_08670 [Nanoarchaeota archaeon]|nr:hypothetical protein [Nanoarchaeota archaeon]
MEEHNFIIVCRKEKQEIAKKVVEELAEKYKTETLDIKLTADFCASIEEHDAVIAKEKKNYHCIYDFDLYAEKADEDPKYAIFLKSTIDGMVKGYF